MRKCPTKSNLIHLKIFADGRAFAAQCVIEQGIVQVNDKLSPLLHTIGARIIVYDFPTVAYFSGQRKCWQVFSFLLLIFVVLLFSFRSFLFRLLVILCYVSWNSEFFFVALEK